jgi:hypothetical protein
VKPQFILQDSTKHFSIGWKISDHDVFLDNFDDDTEFQFDTAKNGHAHPMDEDIFFQNIPQTDGYVLGHMFSTLSLMID